MSSPATYMRARVLYRLKDEFGVTNVDESQNYWIKFDYKGHHFEFNTSSSWWSVDGGQKIQGNQMMFDKLNKLKNGLAI